MAYHISLSQDGRSYALLMFFGIAGLYFFYETSENIKKVPASWLLFCCALLHTVTVPSFIALSQFSLVLSE
jgi:hypothetical protein